MFKISAFLLIAIFSIAPALSADKKCLKLILKSIDHIDEDNKIKHVTANGISVTGDGFMYPLDSTLRAFDIDMLEVQDLKGKKVLSLGEGFGGLVSHLNHYGVDITGVDIWYNKLRLPKNDVGRMMKAYVKENKKKLVTAFAQELPFEDESFDTIYSANLMRNINDYETTEEIYLETLRVLKTGGMAKFIGVDIEMIQRFAKKHDDKAYFNFDYDDYYEELNGTLIPSTINIVEIIKVGP